MPSHTPPGPHPPPDPRQSADQMLRIIRTLPDVIFQCEKGPDGRIYWSFNEGKLAEEFHLTTQLIRGKPLDDIFPPDVVARIKPEFERAFQGEAREFTNELFGRYFKHFPQPIRDADGKVTAVVGFITEVTNLVRQEQEIRGLNNELERRVEELAVANRELETYGYSVSHDLRSPLAVIENHARVLLTRDRAQLPEAASESLNAIRAAVERMSHLITDLLHLSQATTGPVARQRVDLAEMARDVSRELMATGPGRRVQWVFPDHLWAEVDVNLVRSVLENLLGNAWKYTAHANPARIELGSHDDGTFFVQDNGEGFDMDEADHLFEAFRRLHSSDGYEGHGIGLATVRRIISRHSGRIWAHSERGKGATFHFTLHAVPHLRRSLLAERLVESHAVH